MAPQQIPVVVVGAGLAGLATAVAAAERGHSVTVLEKAAQAGGAASFSGGQVWIAANDTAAALGIEDSIEDGERYVRALAGAHPESLDVATMERWLTTAPRAARYFEEVGAVTWEVIRGFADYYQDEPGARTEGRYLTARFDRRDLGDWADRLQVTPHFPIGLTYAELFSAGHRATAFGASDDVESDGPTGRDRLTFGTGVVAGFLAAAVRRGVDIRLDHRATELISEAGRVSGVRADTPSGTQVFEGAVVLATSGFDWDAGLVREYVGVEAEDQASIAPRTLEGDGLRLARQAGAAVTRFPGNRIPLLAGYADPSREPGFASVREHCLPHTFVVDRSGRRFADDSVYWELVKKAIDPDDPHMPCWMIWDEQHHAKYGLGSTPPGAPYPGGLVEQAPTLAELGRKLGIDGEALEQTAERFNPHAERGEDPEFGRGRNLAWRTWNGDPNHQPNEAIGPVSRPPFYGMRLRMTGTGINLTGIAVDTDGRAIDERGQVVEGLYAVGACAAFTSSGVGYNSGFSLSRAITFGLLVAERLQGDAPGALPEPLAEDVVS